MNEKARFDKYKAAKAIQHSQVPIEVKDTDYSMDHEAEGQQQTKRDIK